MMPPRILLLPLIVLLGSLSSPARPQGRPETRGGPDVLILVAATSDGQDQIGITYAKTVPRPQAQHDLAALAAASGWSLRHITITDAASSLKRDRVRMTGAECVAAHVIRPHTHGLAVKPFVQAFRNYPNVLLTYFVGQGFHFQGLHDYADNYVQIKMNQQGGAYTYRIFIRNPRFDRLDMPYLQPPGGADVRAARRGPEHGLQAWLFALGAVAAVGAGWGLYALLSRTA